MSAPRLRIKSLTRDRPRGRSDDPNKYSAAYRFRTGHMRSPRRCRNCGSVFPEHLCGAPDRED